MDVSTRLASKHYGFIPVGIEASAIEHTVTLECATCQVRSKGKSTEVPVCWNCGGPATITNKAMTSADFWR